MGEFAFTCRKEKIHSMWLGVLITLICLSIAFGDIFVPWFTKPFRDRNDGIIQRGRQPRKTVGRVTYEETLKEHMSWIYGNDRNGGKEGNGKC